MRLEFLRLVNILVLLTLLAFLVGHVAITVTALNVSYGQGWISRIVLKGFRVVHDLWMVAGTPWLAWVIFRSGFVASGDWLLLTPLLQAYTLCCVVTGAVAVPGVVILRWRRRLPAAQLSNHSHTIDIAAQLGRRPIGSGSHQFMVRWPWNEQFQLEVIERTYRLPRLPAELDGLSILHLSDLHFTGTIGFKYFERVIEQANQLDCDLVAFTGDLVDRPTCHEWVPQLFARLKSRHGVFAILGNHDSWCDHDRIRRDLTAAGVRMLSGRWESIQLRGQPLVIAGTEYPWMGRLPDLSAAPRDAFRLLLSHTPDNAPWAARAGFDLMLAGHNHGGQVRLPVVGPVFMPSRYGRHFDMGAFQIGRTLMHVSRGVSGKHPYRFGCKPELTKIVLAN